MYIPGFTIDLRISWCHSSLTPIDSPFRPGRLGAGSRVGASAVVWADSLELVAPGIPAPGEFTSGRGGLLALGWLEPIGRFRAGVGRLGRVRPLPVLGLPGPGRVGAGRVGVGGSTDRPDQCRDDSGSVRGFVSLLRNEFDLGPGQNPSKLLNSFQSDLGAVQAKGLQLL